MTAGLTTLLSWQPQSGGLVARAACACAHDNARGVCMHSPLVRIALPCAIIMVIAIAACTSVGSTDTGPVASPPNTVGTNPKLTEPDKKLVPIVQIAEAKRWAPGMKPTATAGIAVNAFATGLDHPRWIHVLPNGDVLVAESNAPERPEDGKGIKGKIMKKMMTKAGAAV